MGNQIIKCEMTNGLARYFNLERVISINEVERGGLIIEFKNAKDEISSASIVRFSMLKVGSNYS